MIHGLTERVSTSTGTIAVGVVGSGPPIVLTHGSPSWSYLWRNIVPKLAENHTVYLWDLPGYGGSTPHEGVRPSIATHARTLADLLVHWKLDMPALVGHDIGGATVLRTHLLHHVPVRALVLLDAVVYTPWIGPDTHHMQTHLDAYRSMPNHLFVQLIAAHLTDTTHRPMPEETKHAYLDMYATNTGQQRWLDRSQGFAENDTAEFLPRLSRITSPTRVIWGADDKWLPVEMGRRLAASIPGSQLTIIPGAGHFVMEDDPAGTAAAIIGALDTERVKP